MGPWNVIMSLRNVIMGPWKLNMGPWNVVMGLCNLIMGPWNLNRGTWDVIMEPRNVNRDCSM